MGARLRTAAAHKNQWLVMLPFCYRTITIHKTRYTRHLRTFEYPPLPKTLAEHLRKRRVEMGLTQPELGRLLGVSRALISHWEYGISSPKQKQHRAALTAFLGLNASKLGEL